MWSATSPVLTALFVSVRLVVRPFENFTTNFRSHRRPVSLYRNPLCRCSFFVGFFLHVKNLLLCSSYFDFLWFLILLVIDIPTFLPIAFWRRASGYASPSLLCRCNWFIHVIDRSNSYHCFYFSMTVSLTVYSSTLHLDFYLITLFGLCSAFSPLR